MAQIETHQAAAVPRSEVLYLLRRLGLDPAHITIAGVHIGHHAITCEIFATDEDGNRYFSSTSPDELARHKISIPVVDAESTHWV